MSKDKKAMGARYNGGKLELQYCPLSTIAAVSIVFAMNSKKQGGKYEDNNWRLGQPLSNHLNSLKRHIAKFEGGEDNDQDDGINHLWHALTNLSMAIEDLINNPDLDDRYKGVQADFSYFQEEYSRLLRLKNDKKS